MGPDQDAMTSDSNYELQTSQRAVPACRVAAQRTRQRGFTLVEMMTTVVVGAILLAVSVPGMSTFMRSSRVNASQAELVSALMLARSETAKRGVRVAVAATAPVSGAEFSGGWTVWVDSNNDGVVDSGETTIRVYPALSSGLLIKTDGATVASYTAAGFLTPATPIAFTVCSRTSGEKGYRVLLEPVGLADVQELASCP